MRASIYLQAVLGACLVTATPAPSATPKGGSAPAGWNASVENFCNAPFVLNCCGAIVAGAAGTADGTASGCKTAIYLISSFAFRIYSVFPRLSLYSVTIEANVTVIQV